MCLRPVSLLPFFLPLGLRIGLFPSHLSTRTAYEFGPFASYVRNVSHQQDFFFRSQFLLLKHRQSVLFV